ncbi:hypothetical protein [Vogesella oryzae]|uniref:hypothetical protein n=1 Tax=Vogesella oryzae TaxID=1735285 RepID=UPI00158392F5|nr:hypothetical protein [Vogesella oryzae]
MANVLQQYLDVFQSAQQRWLDANGDYWQQLWRVQPLFGSRQHLSSQLESSLTSGASLLRASADMHHDLQVLGERWLGRQQKSWQQYTAVLPRQVLPCFMPLEAGLSGCLIASRASRQIHHFASTRLSTVPLHAVRGVQRVYHHQGK